MPHPGTNASRKTYFGVQALRAVAAAAVVLSHAADLWATHTQGRPWAADFWLAGASGVDIFFVISGFVMMVTAPGLAGEANKGWVFLKRRLIRIVPLYWFFTTLSLTRLAFGPAGGAAFGGQIPGSAWHIVASYLFIHSFDASHVVTPVLGVGWTLNYEMMFYLLFTVALALDVSLLAFLVPVLLALAAIGFLHRPAWPAVSVYASPIVLEFLFGVLIAHWTLQGRRLNKFVCITLYFGGCIALATIPKYDHMLWRGLAWGIPAAAIVAATVRMENAVGRRLPRWLLEAGNASYATYLVHRPLLVTAWPALLLLGGKFSVVSSVEMIVSALLISLLAGEAVHRFVELPLLGLFGRRRVRGVGVLPGRAMRG